MLTPKVDQPATSRTGASGDRAVFFSTRSELMWDAGPTASHTRVGCCSPPSRLVCECWVLVKVMIGDMNNVDVAVLYIVPIQGMSIS